MWTLLDKYGKGSVYYAEKLAILKPDGKTSQNDEFVSAICYQSFIPHLSVLNL